MTLQDKPCDDEQEDKNFDDGKGIVYNNTSLPRGNVQNNCKSDNDDSNHSCFPIIRFTWCCCFAQGLGRDFVTIACSFQYPDAKDYSKETDGKKGRAFENVFELDAYELHRAE